MPDDAVCCLRQAVFLAEESISLTAHPKYGQQFFVKACRCLQGTCQMRGPRAQALYHDHIIGPVPKNQSFVQQPSVKHSCRCSCRSTTETSNRIGCQWSVELSVTRACAARVLPALQPCSGIDACELDLGLWMTALVPWHRSGSAV